MSRWFSSRTQTFPSQGLDGFLQAVGDPFKFPDLPLQDGEPAPPADYEPMIAAVILIGFASSDLWRTHLHHSNFTSCEEIFSTREGQKTAFTWMLETWGFHMPEFLSTAAKIRLAITRLEELQCFNTIEVVIIWAWTVGVVNPVDHDGWRSIGHETLRFYQTHGTRRLTVLRQHITGTAQELKLSRYLWDHYLGSTANQVESEEEQIPESHPRYRARHWYRDDFGLAQACQVRRLYHLFGCDPITWKEIAAVEGDGVLEEIDPLPERSATPAPFIGLGMRLPIRF
jgi:hypothetical protein